jgi:hypothetical protein
MQFGKGSQIDGQLKPLCPMSNMSKLDNIGRTVKLKVRVACGRYWVITNRYHRV